ncbi:MAG: DUF427 domain-containing protein [Woeseiaceae bacterium]
MTGKHLPPEWIVKARQHWDTAKQPNDIVEPGPDQESVWDFPRPPSIQPVQKPVRVIYDGVTIVETNRAKRICETASPPTYYIPRSDIVEGALQPIDRSSLCEWKGNASYFDVGTGKRLARGAAWCYPRPYEEFVAIAGWVAFMPAAMDACYVGDDQVRPQPGGFYGGWITPELTGPFKGEPGTGHW